MTQKIIFLDVDGTLVNYENQLPASAVTAIRQAQANGHLVYTVTGRSKAEMYENVTEVGFDGYIGANGSYIEIGEEVFKHQSISPTDERAIVDWLESRGLEYFLEANSGLYASRNFEERSKPAIRDYSAMKGVVDAATIMPREIFPDMIFDGEDFYRDDVNKISFVLDSYQDHLDAQAAFPHLKHGTWGGAGEKALFGDIALGGINKATAIDELLSHLGLSASDAFAFGDAKVDIPMLEHCGTGVAMGNGGDEIKAMADYITTDVDDDGLYKAFEHFELI